MALNSKTEKKSKGTWFHRFAIWVFTFVLTVLVFWALGFFVDDIRSIRGPDYPAIEKEFVNKDLMHGRPPLKSKLPILRSGLPVRRKSSASWETVPEACNRPLTSSSNSGNWALKGAFPSQKLSR